MTDIATTQIAARSIRIPSLSAAVLVIGKGIGRLLKACGQGFFDLSRAYAHALELTYVKPVRISVERRRLALDADLDGRDPNW